MPRPNGSVDRDQEWRKPLLALVAGLLVFETLTGLAIWLLPFSVANQVTVLLHTGVGLVFLLPYLVYQIRHWRVYREARLTHVKLTGYFSLVATSVAIVSGLVLTAQAVFGTRISYAWDTVHIVSTLALVAAAVPHVGALLVRNTKGTTELARRVRRAEWAFSARSGAVLGGAVLPVVLLTVLYEPVELHNELPEDYSTIYGEDRPFAPSMARTSTGDAFDARSMGGSESCGTAGCHDEIAAEWRVSAHRWAAMDPGFRVIQSTMGEQNGPESTRYCAGCHDPISLFAGTKNLFQDELTNPMGLDEGVSCIACHSIEETDVQGNANYTIEQPERYIFELEQPEGARRWVRDFLIRAYPDEHVETFSRSLFKSPEFCAACHKQFIDEEINRVGWVQLQNQFDNWRKSRWNHPGEPEKTIECRECHMPLVESDDPATGDELDYNRSVDDGMHRSHRFLGANQFIPELLEIPGAEEHVALTEQWLRGEIEIPEIAHKWREGPAVPIELLVPETFRPGEEITIRTRMTNNKVGHDFPTGPLDIIQAWVEVVVKDQDGNQIWATGQRDEQHYIEPGSFIFKAEPVDRYGNPIDRHNLWEMVGVRYRRALFPGFSDQAEFAFVCPSIITSPEAFDADMEESMAMGVPGDGVTELHVEARLLYRKFDQTLLSFLYGEDAGVTSNITVISEDEAVIPAAPGAVAGADASEGDGVASAFPAPEAAASHPGEGEGDSRPEDGVERR